MTVIGNALVGGNRAGRPLLLTKTLIGVVESALAAPEIGKVYGAIHGIQGILDGNICDFSEEDASTFETVAGTPSSALLSVRLKANKDLCEKIFERCKQLDVRFSFISAATTRQKPRTLSSRWRPRRVTTCVVSTVRRPSITTCE